MLAVAALPVILLEILAGSLASLIVPEEILDAFNPLRDPPAPENEDAVTVPLVLMLLVLLNVPVGPGGPVTLGPGGPEGPGSPVTLGPGGPSGPSGPVGPVTLGPGGPVTLGPGGPSGPSGPSGPGGPVTLGPGGPVTLGPGGPVTLGPGGPSGPVAPVAPWRSPNPVKPEPSPTKLPAVRVFVFGLYLN